MLIATPAAYDVGAITGNDKPRPGRGERYVARRLCNSASSFWLNGNVVADASLTYNSELGGRRVSFHFELRSVSDQTYHTAAMNRYDVAVGDPLREIGTMSFAFL